MDGLREKLRELFERLPQLLSSRLTRTFLNHTSLFLTFTTEAHASQAASRAELTIHKTYRYGLVVSVLKSELAVQLWRE
jgi:hypothetical protein